MALINVPLTLLRREHNPGYVSQDLFALTKTMATAWCLALLLTNLMVRNRIAV